MTDVIPSIAPNNCRRVVQKKSGNNSNNRCSTTEDVVPSDPILYAVTALQGDDFPLRDNLSCFEVVSRYVRSSQWQRFLNW